MNTPDMSELILKRIVAINTIYKNDNKTVTRNDRSTYAVTMKIAGRTTYFCKGKKYVSDVKNMLFIDKNAKYQWHMDERGKCVMIEFEADMPETQFDFADFTLAYNVSPIRYLRSVRIKKAMELLISDAASISDIAEMAGYGSVYNFSKMFKAETGASPSEYAKAYSNRVKQ